MAVNLERKKSQIGCQFEETVMQPLFLKTRRVSPVYRRPSTAEAPPIGKIHAFSEMAITFEPLMRF